MGAIRADTLDVPQRGRAGVRVHDHHPLHLLRQDFTEAGRRCLQLLVALIENRDSAMSVKIAPQLVVRSSTGRPRK